MLTSKQRARLRAMANRLDPIFQIGKGGVNDNMLNDISAALDARELIKISVLRSSEESAAAIIDGLAGALDAEGVAAIGSKIILYRRSSRKNIEHIII